MRQTEIARLTPDKETLTLAQEIEPQISTKPALPAIDFSLVNQQAPTLVATPSTLPKADVIIITWANAEWAALEHVFCQGNVAMPYSSRTKGNWTGWVTDAQDLPAYSDKTWDHWGAYRLIEVGNKSVLLYKSNTHLDWPGQTILEGMMQHLITAVQPQLVLSLGTAGGTRDSDAVGTVAVTRVSTLYETSGTSPVYTSSWQTQDTILDMDAFSKLLFPIPTTEADLQTLCDQFNAAQQTSYQLADLNPDNLNLGTPLPKINELTQNGTSLLTTSTFVVGTTDGTFANYACIEMDDAVLEKVCTTNNVSFGSVRNISDPMQNAQLPAKIQGGWGSVIYKAYGFYTSYNGAITAWAIVSAS